MSDQFDPLLNTVEDRFRTSMVKQPALFTTYVEGLYQMYLKSLPLHERQTHTCNSCRHFIERYGSLVTIDDKGHTHSVMWGPAPGIYAKSFEMMRVAVESAEIIGVFHTSELIWGTPHNRAGNGVIWKHMAVVPDPDLIYHKTPLKNAEQFMAERKEEYGMLQRGLEEFPQAIVTQALALLEAEALYRNEKCVGPAKWLLDLHEQLRKKNGRSQRNLVWRAVASAPPGFCHVSSTMIGTLLEDLKEGLPIEHIKKRFADKMHPLKYQRPQAPPKQGNIDQAEKVIAALRSEGSLDRRYARLDEIETIWMPHALRNVTGRVSTSGGAKTGGVFDHLRDAPKQAPNHLGAAGTMTWTKFAKEVLPKADSMRFYAAQGRSPFIALVTAVNPKALPILQWDLPERRNPVSWYLYSGGSTPSDWNLRTNSPIPITAVTQLPSMWNDQEGHYAHQGEGVIFILEGCKDVRASAGLCLFPEILKSEYHGIRSTIEAFSHRGALQGGNKASACGIDLRKGTTWNYEVQVTSKGLTFNYTIDRWD